MGSNLLISFSLQQPKQTYDEVIDTIHALGDWAKVDDCVLYVHSSCSANQACARLWAVMNPQDRLVVVDATNNDLACIERTATASRILKQSDSVAATLAGHCEVPVSRG